MIYRAKVTSVDKSTGKIRVHCPSLWESSKSPWVYPCVPFISDKIVKKGSAGGVTLSITITKDDIMRLPKVNEGVWIMLEQDSSLSTPIYIGTWEV